MDRRGVFALEFLWKAVYYGVSGIGVLVFAVFFLADLFGFSTSSDTSAHSKVLRRSGLTGLAFLGGSFVTGHLGEQWALGIGLAVAGMLVFGVMMLAGKWMHMKAELQ